MQKEKQNEDLRTMRTKKHLSKALTELLSKHSIDEITIIQICNKANVHRTTFYKHFIDKFDLFTYVIDEIRDELYEKTTSNQSYDNAKSLFMNLANTSLDYLEEHRTILTNILKHNKDDMIAHILLTSTDKSLQLLLERNKEMLSTQIPLDIISKFYTGGLITLISWWLLNPSTYTKAHILKYLDILIDEKIYSNKTE